MGTTDDRTHEEKVARLLELEEAREQRRRARMKWLPWIIAALVVVAIVTAIVVQKQREQAAHDCLVGQYFDSMVGNEVGDC